MKRLPRPILGVPPSVINSGEGGFGGAGVGQSCCQRVAAAVSSGSEVDDGAGDVGNCAWKTPQPLGWGGRSGGSQRRFFFFFWAVAGGGKKFAYRAVGDGEDGRSGG